MNRFLKNVFTLLVGTGFSQFIVLLASPVLARLYNPHQFGIFAFFVSTCSILAIISTGRYEMSILHPKQDHVAYNILLWSFLLAILTNVLIALLLILCGNFLFHLFDGRIRISTLYLMPIGTFFSATIQILTFWFSRQGRFKYISSLKVLQSSVVVFASILLGHFYIWEEGLIMSFIFGGFIVSVPLVFIVWKGRSMFSMRILKIITKKYSDFPKYMMTSSFLDSFAMQAPIFFITKFFLPRIVGSYSMSFRLGVAPVGIISGAFGQVYLQKVTSVIRDKSQLIRPFVVSAFKMLFVISLLIFIPVFFWGTNLILFFFGTDWIEAGIYLEILALAMLVRFVVSPLSSVFVAISDIKSSSKWQLLYFITTVSVFILGRNLGIIHLLWLYVIHEVILYSLYLVLIMLSIKKFDKKFVCVE